MEPRKPPPATAGSEITGCGPSPTGAVTTAALSGSPMRQAAPSSSDATAVAVAASLLAAAAGLGGVALLAWWAVAFRRADAMLWMVPAGLVLLGTPLIAWLSVLASGTASRPPADAAQPS